MLGSTKNTPEEPGNAPISKPGFLRRLAAILYDLLLLIAVLFVATALLLPLNAGEAFTAQQFFFPLYLLLVSFLFYAWFWTHGGQTLGLRAWKIKLLTLEGKPISWKQALLRFMAAILSWGFCGLGFLWILVDENQRSWHDRLSKTELFFDDHDTHP
ncbi:MAG: RDD family protein [Methylobacter sp.]|nr:MAG: RDD family protein [Methylobacter sp.]